MKFIGLRQEAQAYNDHAFMQQVRRDWVQQFCLKNILVHAQKYANDAKTFLKHFCRL